MAELPLPPAEEGPADLTLKPETHPIDSAPTENPTAEIGPLCRFFLEGRCRFGARCRSPHPNTSDTPNLEDHRPTSQDLPPHHPSGKKPAMKTAEDVISRLLWDTQVPAERFSIGYLDRFLGTLEEPFTAFSWEDLASAGPGVLAIPKHRIQYFKYGERVVWEKASRTDEVFGSTGSGRTILQVIEEAEAEREKAQSHASGGEGGKGSTGGRTGHPGEEVGHLDSASDVEEGVDRAAGGREGMRELEEAKDNIISIEHGISEGSEITHEAGGKVVESGVVGHSVEEAESSEPVLNVKRGHSPVMAEDEKNGASESRDGGVFPGHKRRPTHFVAIQITGSKTREAVRHVQKALCQVRPDLAQFCVPLATLHLTLCLLRLDTPEDIYRAVTALRELQANSRRLLPPALLLSFQGVEAFHSHVLYMRPASTAELGTLAHVLEDAFCRKDLTVILPPSKDKFHLTVVKIPPGKQGPQLPEDSSWIPPVEDLGTEAVEALYLCEARQGRRTDGFYTTVLRLDLY
ncbi:PREDICTED: leukocyte receptor cluster member 9 [Gekko japonicus]|uniref:Leukocyte receptor cluster member 9 n=1 Tax=Gekko japonicus TaxID=146911 RepID=A0ABM1KGL5_GEKJA|nr:PREDICTED: leukocyte receptor cluster member 9 [Gekko japonicus]